MQWISRAGWLQKVVFFFSLAPTFGGREESVKDGTTGRQRRHAGWEFEEEKEKE